ncbi:hypothetical protein ACFL59_12910 [Planctomycetota bacterium]
MPYDLKVYLSLKREVQTAEACMRKTYQEGNKALAAEFTEKARARRAMMLSMRSRARVFQLTPKALQNHIRRLENRIDELWLTDRERAQRLARACDNLGRFYDWLVTAW